MKIIYLDQFVLQKAFCPSSADTHKDYFVQVGEMCENLARKGIAAFPFSECHLHETALLRQHSQKGKMAEAIAEKFAAISKGYQFCSAQGIQQMQASAVRKNSPIDWSPHRAIFRHTKLGFRERLLGTIADDRNLHHAALKPVLLQYVGATEDKLSGIAQREAQAFGELLTKDLTRIMTGAPPDLLSLIANPHFRLFMELEAEMRAEGISDSLNAAYCFIRDRAMEVPCIRLESRLWEYFIKTKRQTLDKENDPASTAEDIRFISYFVPYCDAAFLESKMAAWVQQSKLWNGFATKLFSLKHRENEFLQYLDGLEKDHVIQVSPKTFSAYEAERLPILRQYARPLLWICFIPTHPNALVRSKIVSLQHAPNSLIDCRFLPGGGIEWIETIPAATSVSWNELESRIRRALRQIMGIPREGCHVSMQINYRLVNCGQMQIQSSSASRSMQIGNDLLNLGISVWYTDGPELLQPRLDEILAAFFQSKCSKRGTREQKDSAAPTGFG